MAKLGVKVSAQDPEVQVTRNKASVRHKVLCAVSGPVREEIDGSTGTFDGPKKGTLKEPLESTGDSLRRTVGIGSSKRLDQSSSVELE